MSRTIKISDMHYDSLLKLSKKYKMKVEEMVEELIEETYNSRVRR